MKSLMRWMPLLVVAGLLSACGGSAKAKLAFSDTRGSGGNRATFTATEFKMKLIAAYLAEDMDPNTGNNTGKTTMIYLNPTCGNDLKHCDVSAGTAEDGAPMSKIITDFFDFSNAAAANAALNSQALEVDPGTYKYARLEFCKYAAGAEPNIQWKYGSTANGQFKQTSCVTNSEVFNPPITIADGGTVTITLSYSLDNTVSDSGSGASCSSGHCFTLPHFTPAVQ